MPRRLLGQRCTFLRVAVLAAILTTRLAAQDLWYAAYTKAVQAFNRNDYAEAEKKFQEALNNKLAPAARGRRVLYYGQLRGEYIPEFYLARIAVAQRRWDDVLKYAELADRYMQRDREYPTLVDAHEVATAARTAPPAVAKASPPDPARPPATSVETSKAPTNDRDRLGIALPPSTPGPYIERPGAGSVSPTLKLPDEKSVEPAPAAVARREFDRLMTQATAAFEAGNYAAATRGAQSAKDLGVDNVVADGLLRLITAGQRTARNEEAQKQISALLARQDWTQAGPLLDALARAGGDARFIKNGQAAVARGLLQQGAGVIERAAVTDFYKGNYRAAADLFERLTPAQATPRILFYQACSNAAVALLEGTAGAPRLLRARVIFARSEPLKNTFERHRRYVSPEILDALERQGGLDGRAR